MRKPGGTLDTRFGNNGLLHPPSGFGFAQVQAWGNGFVAALHYTKSAGGAYATYDNLAFARYDNRGHIDRSFGVNGIAKVISYPSIEVNAESWAVSPSGEIVAVGIKNYPEDPYFDPYLDERPPPVYTIVKLTSAGLQDANFGEHGAITLSSRGMSPPQRPADSTAFVHWLPLRVFFDPTDRIRVIGEVAWTIPHSYLDSDENPRTSYEYAQNFLAMTAIDVAGNVDTSFSPDGSVYPVLPGRIAEEVGGKLMMDVATRADGQVIAYAHTSNQNSARTSFYEFAASSSDYFATINTTGQKLGFGGRIRWLPDGRAIMSGGNHGTKLVMLNRDSQGHWSFSDQVDALPTAYYNGDAGDLVVTANGNLLFSGDWSYYVEESPDHLREIRLQFLQVQAGDISDGRRSHFANARENAIGSNFDLHFIYQDSAAGALKYATKDRTGRWKATQSIATTAGDDDFLDLALDKDDRPMVAFYDAATADLKFAQLAANGTWRTETVDSKKATGQYPSLQLGDDGTPWIAYYNRTAGDLRLAHRTAAGWQIETVDSVGDTGLFPDLRVGSSGRWSIAYVARDSKKVRLAERQKGGAWKFSDVATTTGGARDVRLAIGDSTDILYHDIANADLLVASRRFDQTSFSLTPIATRGTTGRSVQLLSSGSSTFAAAWWDATRQLVVYGYFERATVRSALHVAYSDIPVTGGGRFLSATPESSSFITGDGVLAYRDAASGDLIVRNY